MRKMKFDNYGLLKLKAGQKLLMKVGQAYWILMSYTMKVSIHELAAYELNEAIEWYENQ